MVTESPRVIVIGGGLIGTASAYYLAKHGWRVTLIERGQFAAGCSHGNCGFICPSHVLPLAAPGAVRKNLTQLLSNDSPLHIKLRFDPALWWWLWQFARRCRLKHMLEAARAQHALLSSSVSLYRRLLANEAIDCQWQDRGVLFVYQSRREFEEFAQTHKLLRERFDVQSKRYDAAELADLEPALRPGLAGGWHFPGDAHLRPDQLLAGWRAVLERLGVKIREQTHLYGFSRIGRHATAAETSRGIMPADAFIVAAGALTPLLNRQLACRLPIQPGKGYSITMPRPKLAPYFPLIFHEYHVAATPFHDAYRLGSTMELAGYDASLNRRRLNLLRAAAEQYLREPYAEPVIEEWFGWRPMTYDGIPYIGRVPKSENVFVAAGHGMLGVSMAPATGKLVAELVSGLEPHLDPAPFSVDRRH
jgi:D-amino-acid dehydrogenase